MTSLKEHVFVGQNDDRGNQRDDNRFHAFCFWSHCYLLLKEVDKEMEDYAGENGTFAHKIDPCDDKAHGNAAYEKIDYKKRIHHKISLISPMNKDQWKMPERP